MNKPSDWIDHNGTLLPAGSPILTARNRGFRYGDGLFETMLVKNGQIRLRDYHFQRLMDGLNLLRYTLPDSLTAGNLEARMATLALQNQHAGLARIRLVLYRGDGGLYDPEGHHPHSLIETSPLSANDIDFHPEGLTIDLFPDGRKACDALANCKSNNFLAYALAALFAKDRRLDDCLVLNSHGRVADSTIANLFYIRAGKIHTPPLSEGCVAGTMRRFLLGALPRAGFPVLETPVTPEDLLAADEVFLTNAIRGIRWVQTFRSARYRCQLSKLIYDKLIKDLL